MILEQVLTRDLGCAAYVVGCDHVHEAVVVDPPLHVGPVLEVCRRHGLRVVGVIETHTHADHVAGHGVLARETGAWIAAHPLGGPGYPFRPIADGDRIVVGQVALDVIHTPGHRPEHCAIAVSDLERGDEPWVLLTGDSLFVGDVARPDLAVGGREGAEVLYRTLHTRLAGLGDGVEVFPGHVAGSLCGRGMSARTSTTLGFERHRNPMLAKMSSHEFVRRANENLAQKPPTMTRIVGLNRGPLVEREPEARTLDALPADAQLLDVRPAADVATGHVPGAIGIPVAVSGFANRAGFVLDPEREVIVLAASEHERADAVRLLGAVGFGRIAVFTGALPGPLESFTPIAAEELDDPALQVLDVRERDEQLETVPGALLVPYRELAGADLSALDPARPVVPVCASGARAAVAATLLARRGFSDVRPVLEGGIPAYLLSAAGSRATPAAAPASAHTP
jgi:glyoxylase-like metal-dependent hydrolase (beta-lactamase superfamily II)/rhodanese-related sulfurtransferase